MPVRNEERHLRASVEGVLAQNYPGELEILLCVAPSDDATASIAADMAAADPRIVVVDNPTGVTPDGLNAGISRASADIIARVDAHGELGPGYLERAVEALSITGAANVGGLMDAQGHSPFEQAVAAAYNSRVGLGGGSFHLKGTPEGPAETVFLGVFRKSTLLEVGGYDPTLLRAQDWDLNNRLRHAGHTVWFSPSLRVTYRPRSSYRALATQFFRTGQWRREVIRRDPSTVRLRYLVPPIAVLGILLGTIIGVAGLVFHIGWLIAGFVAALAYAVFVVAAALGMRGVALAVRVRLVPVLAVMHGSWGIGFLKGLPKAARERVTEPAPF